MIAVVDVETTGLDPAIDTLVACAVVTPEGVVLLDTRVNPERPIQAEASAVHHLTDEDVRDAPPRSVVRERLTHISVPVVSAWGGRCVGVTWASHNAPFEQAFLPEIAKASWICTLRVAHHLWPEAPAFGLQTLRYHLKLPVAGMRPHSALDDARVTVALLQHEIETITVRGSTAPVDELIRLTTTPALLRMVKFGKHRGMRWSDVPTGYLAWAARQSWDDPDVTATIAAAREGRYA